MKRLDAGTDRLYSVPLAEAKAASQSAGPYDTADLSARRRKRMEHPAGADRHFRVAPFPVSQHLPLPADAVQRHAVTVDAVARVRTKDRPASASFRRLARIPGRDDVIVNDVLAWTAFPARRSNSLRSLKFKLLPEATLPNLRPMDY